MVVLKPVCSLYICIVPKQDISQFRIKELFNQLFSMTTHIHNLQETTPLYGLLRDSGEYYFRLLLRHHCVKVTPFE